MRAPHPIPTDIGQIISYDPDTGHLTRIKSKYPQFVGINAAKEYVDNGYLQVLLPVRRRIPAHRVAWFLHYGIDPGEFFIDHINGDKHDNRIKNLRLATPSQNTCNFKPRQNASGLPTGVYAQRPSGFGAKIQCRGVTHCLGTFITPELAHEAYIKASVRLHGEFSSVLRP